MNRKKFTIKYYAGIDLISQDPQIMFSREIRELLKRFPAKYRAGWIVGRVKNQHAGSRRDFCSDFFKVGLKIIFFFQPKRNRGASESARKRWINRKPRIRVKNFISGLNERQHRQR